MKENPDINDTLRDEGEDAVRKRHDRARKYERKTNGDGGEQSTTSLAIIDAFPIDETTIPQRAWVVPGLLLRRHVTVLVAPSASGKSLLALPISIACAVHIDWAKWRPRHACKVLIVNAEDDVDEMRRRLCGAATTMNVNQADLVGRIILADNPSGIVVAQFNARSKTLVRTPLMEELVKTIVEQKIDIVWVDPFAETFEGDENSNSELKWAAMLWREVARRTNTAVVLNHHTKKYATGMAGDMDASRGGGALIGIARILSTMFPMTAEEAQLMEVPDEERHKFVRYDDAKANLNLITRQACWFKKETYTINNATEELPGDDVGVLVPWLPPGPLDNVTTTTINQILDEIDRGLTDDEGDPTGEFFTFHNKANKDAPSRWVGQVIQRWIQCSDERAAVFVKQWRMSGLLVEFPYKNRRRKPVTGVRSDPTKRPGRGSLNYE
jgi:hypothetical protein